MQQHPVPQNIMAVEFQLVGSMTIRQFIYVAAAAVIDGIIYALNLYPIISWPLIGIISLIGLGLAFVPINDLPLDRWLVAFFNSVTSPTRRIWHKEPKSLDYLLPTFVTVTKPDRLPNLSPNREKLDNYLNSFKKPANNGNLEEYEKKFLSKLDFNTGAQAESSQPAVNAQTISKPSLITETVHSGSLAMGAGTNVAAAIHTGNTSTYIPKVGVVQNRAINPSRVAQIAPKLPASGHIPTVPTAMLKTNKTSTTSSYDSTNSLAAVPPKQTSNETLINNFRSGAVSQNFLKPSFPDISAKADLATPQPNQPQTTVRQEANSSEPTKVKPEPAVSVMPATPEPTQPVAPPVDSQIEMIIKQKDELENRMRQMQEQLSKLQTSQPVAAAAPVETPTITEPEKPAPIPVAGTTSVEPISTTASPTQTLEPALAEPAATPIKPSAPFTPQILPPQPAIGRLSPPKPIYPNVVSGWVRDGNGQLITDTMIVIKDTKDNPLRAFKSNKMGKFSITTPLPDGKYFVEAEKEGYNFNITQIDLNGQIINPIEIKAV